MNGQIRDKGRFIWVVTLEITNTHVKMNHSPINDYFSVLFINPASIKGNEHVLQDLFLWLPWHPLPLQSKRNESPVLSRFIWLKDCWMDWSQLIRQWQEALLLAQWPIPTKDRNYQQNSQCPQIDFWMPTKPRRCHSKLVVSHCVTSIWLNHLNSAMIRQLWICITVTKGEQMQTHNVLFNLKKFLDSLIRCNLAFLTLVSRLKWIV